MEPVEINAGDWYLRGLRADDRVDDRPQLAEAGLADPDHVARRAAAWADDRQYSWAVCEPTTGELLAEIVLTPDPDAGTAQITGRARPGRDAALEDARAAVNRFAAGALALTVTTGAAP